MGSWRKVVSPRDALMKASAAALLGLALVHPVSLAKQSRSNAARLAFVHSSPCPATGQPKLPCHGYVIDHIQPLCAGGEDHPRNMQWQTIAESKTKDQQEIRMCTRLRHSRP